MNVQFADLLREVEEEARQNGEVPQAAREAGQFLNILAKTSGAKNILEVGTAQGYNTLWLAEAATANDGTVITIEQDVWRLEQAREVITRSPHADRVQVIQGDPIELLAVLEGPFDFVLLDADKTQTMHYFHLVFERVASGGIICCDKAMSKTGLLAAYLAYVHERPGLDSVLVPIGEGIEITYKVP